MQSFIFKYSCYDNASCIQRIDVTEPGLRALFFSSFSDSTVTLFLYTLFHHRDGSKSNKNTHIHYNVSSRFIQYRLAEKKPRLGEEIKKEEEEERTNHSMKIYMVCPIS